MPTPKAKTYTLTFTQEGLNVLRAAIANSDIATKLGVALMSDIQRMVAEQDKLDAEALPRR
jgi:hypothetical protein